MSSDEILPDDADAKLEAESATDDVDAELEADAADGDIGLQTEAVTDAVALEAEAAANQADVEVDAEIDLAAEAEADELGDELEEESAEAWDDDRPPLEISEQELLTIVEAVLFTADHPVTAHRSPPCFAVVATRSARRRCARR